MDRRGYFSLFWSVVKTFAMISQVSSLTFDHFFIGGPVHDDHRRSSQNPVDGVFNGPGKGIIPHGC